MAVLRDNALADADGAIEAVRPAGPRRVRFVLHDVDGTHSLIREWHPVMSATLGYAMTSGLGDDFDSETNLAALVEQIDRLRTDETERFCVDSAGLSSLTQMEFGVRRAIQLGRVPPTVARSLPSSAREANDAIVSRIWQGQERFDDAAQPTELLAFVGDRTSRLLAVYERALHRVSLERNIELARRHPERLRVPGSLEFLDYLRSIGCRNFFVTGAVLQPGGGMLAELELLGYRFGPGQAVEEILGSTPQCRWPKRELFAQLIARHDIDPAETMVIGDGRAEIEAAIAIGAVAVSRLDASADYARQLHRRLGTQYIIQDYTHPALRRWLAAK